MRKFFKESSLYIVVILIIILAVAVLGKDPKEVRSMKYTELITHIDNGNVASVVSVGDDIVKGKLKDKTEFTVRLPKIAKMHFEEKISEEIDNKNSRRGRRRTNKVNLGRDTAYDNSSCYYRSYLDFLYEPITGWWRKWQGNVFR